jgi:hypothetical protein
LKARGEMRRHQTHTIDNVTWIHGTPSETKLSAQSKALSKSTLKFTSSVSKLNSDAQANTNFSVSIDDVLKEIQESTQDLIENIGNLKKCISKVSC